MTKERKFKDVKPEGEIRFIRASKLKEDGVKGEILQGTFIEAIPNSIDDKKLDYKFETEDGDLVVINGAGNLGFSMKFVDVGEYVQVCYNGMQEITKGPQKGRQSHNFSVLREETE